MFFFKAAVKVYIQNLDDFDKILIKSYINFLLNSLEPNTELFKINLSDLFEIN